MTDTLEQTLTERWINQLIDTAPPLNQEQKDIIAIAFTAES